MYFKITDDKRRILRNQNQRGVAMITCQIGLAFLAVKLVPLPIDWLQIQEVLWFEYGEPILF